MCDAPGSLNVHDDDDAVLVVVWAPVGVRVGANDSTTRTSVPAMGKGKSGGRVIVLSHHYPLHVTLGVVR